MNILLADDHLEIRSALRLLLEQEPEFNITGEATEVVGLVTQVQATQPDLVLLDWELPGLSLLAPVDSERALISTLHAHCPRIKVVALSGRPEAREEALVAGVEAFVSKGDSPKLLLATLRNLDGKREQNQEL
jgi:DNA-binding NarL/FixJ family response regulator